MSSKLDMDRFDGKGDFSLWKAKMKGLLIYNKVFEAIELDDFPDEDPKEEKKLSKRQLWDMSKVAHSIIMMHLSDKVLRVVGVEGTAKELWDNLNKNYLVTSLPNQILLKEKLYSFKCNPSKTFEESLEVFIKITTDLANMGEPVKAVDQAVILLNSLPDTYNDAKAAIKYGRTTLVFSEVVDAIKSKDMELRNEKKGSEVFYSRGREDKRFSGQPSTGGYRSKSRSSSKPRNETKKCFHCNKEGHLKKNCFAWKKLKNKGVESSSKGDKTDANLAQELENARLFVTTENSSTMAELNLVQSREEEWIVDSGCSFHMTQNRAFLFDLEPVEGRKVFMGNDQHCKVEGIGSVRLKLHDGSIGVLTNVRLVPELKRNLISLGALDKLGYAYKGSNGTLKILKGSLVVMKGQLKTGLYVLNGNAISIQAESCQVSAPTASGKDSKTSELWHKRMGHISENGLQMLHKQGLIGSEKFSSLEPCEHCILGKSTRVQFGKGEHCTKGKLDYVHADLWGPASIATHGGAKYFLSIVDDFSRKVWVFPIKLKSDAFQVFKEWLLLVQNQNEKKVKVLRTDNGLEFLNSNFKGLCDDQGIKRHLTIPYTPQQNGVVERMNRTLLEKARCMMLASKMPIEFWGEAVVTAAYLVNRSPSSALEGKTPEEKWNGRAPNLENLRVFGCAAYAHVAKDKLEARALKCVFLGYSVESKAYKLWCIEKDKEKCLISRNVKFLEQVMPFQEQGMLSGSVGNSDSKNSTFFELNMNSGEDVHRSGNFPSSSSAGQSSREAAGQSSNDVSVGNSSSHSRPVSDASTEHLSSRASNDSSTPRTGSSDRNPSSGSASGLGNTSNSMSSASGLGNVDEVQDLDSSSGVGIFEDIRNQQDLRMDSSRMRRSVKPPVRFGFDEFALNVDDIEEPMSLKNVEESAHKKEWLKAIEDELQSLNKNSTWVLVPKPSNQRVVGCKWIFKVKIEGKSVRFKARLVAKGFSQESGIDYNEVFSPVVRHTSIRVLLALTAKDDLELEQMDVKTAFLHGDLEETVYMQQPPGFEQKGAENLVCLLKKSLYGLKQSPRQWYKRFDTFIVSKGFVRSMYDSCVYMLHGNAGKSVYLLLYVDDMLLACKDMKKIKEIKAMLSLEFEMKDLGPSQVILGMEIKRKRSEQKLFLAQSKYIWKMLKTFNMDNSKVVSLPLAPHFKLSMEQCPKTDRECEEMEMIPYSNAIGSLMYTMVCTRPDLAQALSMVSRFMSKPGKQHWEAVKWVFRYLNGSVNGCLSFCGDGWKNTATSSSCVAEIEGYVDADYAADLDRRRSSTGFIFKVFGSCVSWKSTLQSVVALSTTESEYIALAAAVKEGMWLQGLVSEMCNKGCKVELKCDSQSAIHLSKHQAHHERTKHIDVRLHFLRDVFGKADFVLKKVSTLENAADMLTKPVPKAKLAVCLELVSFSND